VTDTPPVAGLRCRVMDVIAPRRLCVNSASSTRLLPCQVARSTIQPMAVIVDLRTTPACGLPGNKVSGRATPTISALPANSRVRHVG
jgi:hypothetical protein